MTDFLQIGLILLPLASVYDFFRASSMRVRLKALGVAISGALLYLLFYQPGLFVSSGFMNRYQAQMVVFVRELVTPRMQNTLLGIAWASLLAMNGVLITGTRIWEYVQGKKWATAGFWLLTLIFAGQVFAETGGWSLVLLAFPSMTTAIAWLQEIAHKIL